MTCSPRDVHSGTITTFWEPVNQGRPGGAFSLAISILRMGRKRHTEQAKPPPPPPPRCLGPHECPALAHLELPFLHRRPHGAKPGAAWRGVGHRRLDSLPHLLSRGKRWITCQKLSTAMPNRFQPLFISPSISNTVFYHNKRSDLGCDTISPWRSFSVWHGR